MLQTAVPLEKWLSASAHRGDVPAEAPCEKTDFQCISDNAIRARGSVGTGRCTLTSLFSPTKELSSGGRAPVRPSSLPGLHPGAVWAAAEEGGPPRDPPRVCGYSGHAIELVQSKTPRSTSSLFLQPASADLAQMEPQKSTCRLPYLEHSCNC